MTASPDLYRTQRTGQLRYQVPVPQPGTWAIVLYTTSAPVGSTAPVFEVRADGATTQRTRIRSTSGPCQPQHILILARATGGLISLEISPLSGTPKISALSITYVRSSTGPLATVFSDSFDGPADATVRDRWRYEVGANGWGNKELQAYTDRAVNASQDGAGHLLIRARRERVQLPGQKPANYSSARLNSRFSATYGHIEARIRFSDTHGLLPAFWMLGEDIYRSGWPEAGEIDIAESQRGYAISTLHGPGSGKNGWSSSRSLTTLQNPSATYHLYSVDWWPGIVQFSVDGEPYLSVTSTDLNNRKKWVFDKPFFILFTLAVGGVTPGTPPSSLSFPQIMSIDYVRWLR